MPLSGSIHVSRPLTNISLAYKSDGLIADMLAPRVNVMHETDQYFIYAKDSLILPNTARANGASANEATWNITTSTYTLAYHSLKSLVTDRDRSNADPAIRLDVDTTEYLTEKIQIRKEVELANLATTPGNWGNVTSLTSTFAWSANTTLSNPISFVDSATSVIMQQAGVKANTVVLDHRTFKAAKEHTSVVDRIKYTSPESVSDGLLARLFNVDRVLIASGIRNTGEEGIAETTTNQNFIWTDAAFVCYIQPSPALKRPSAFYQLTKSEFGNPWKVKKWREEEREGDFIEVSSMFQHKVIASDAAYLIVNTVQ